MPQAQGTAQAPLLLASSVILGTFQGLSGSQGPWCRESAGLPLKVVGVKTRQVFTVCPRECTCSTACHEHVRTQLDGSQGAGNTWRDHPLTRSQPQAPRPLPAPPGLPVASHGQAQASPPGTVPCAPVRWGGGGPLLVLNLAQLAPQGTAPVVWDMPRSLQGPCFPQASVQLHLPGPLRHAPPVPGTRFHCHLLPLAACPHRAHAG